MRKLIVLSLLGVVTMAAGCLPCGTRRPGFSLFGTGRANNQCCPQPVQCCDPCGGSGGAAMSGGEMYSGGEMMMSPAPAMQQAPCCQ